MAHQMNFDHLLTYDVDSPGISLEVTLAFSDVNLTIPAKLDTGAANSIFERRYAEQFGLSVESGYRQLFSTATGVFIAYGHNLMVNIAGIEFWAMVFFAEDEYYNRNVIGRFGGMDHLIVGIIDYEGKLFLSSYDEHVS